MLEFKLSLSLPQNDRLNDLELIVIPHINVKVISMNIVFSWSFLFSPNLKDFIDININLLVNHTKSKANH